MSVISFQFFWNLCIFNIYLLIAWLATFAKIKSLGLEIKHLQQVKLVFFFFLWSMGVWFMYKRCGVIFMTRNVYISRVQFNLSNIVCFCPFLSQRKKENKKQKNNNNKKFYVFFFYAFWTQAIILREIVWRIKL